MTTTARTVVNVSARGQMTGRMERSTNSTSSAASLTM
jgi:hypothetical protein